MAVLSVGSFTIFTFSIFLWDFYCTSGPEPRVFLDFGFLHLQAWGHLIALSALIHPSRPSDGTAGLSKIPIFVCTGLYAALIRRYQPT